MSFEWKEVQLEELDQGTHEVQMAWYVLSFEA